MMPENWRGTSLGDSDLHGRGYLSLIAVRSIPLAQLPAQRWPVPTALRIPAGLLEDDRAAKLVLVLESLLAAASVEEAATALLRDGGACIGAELGRVLLVSEDSATDVEVAGFVGLPKELTERRIGPEVPAPAHDAIRLQSIISIETSEEWRERYSSLAAVLESVGVGACVAAPLVCEGRVVGALELALAQPRELLAFERDLLERVARHGALVLERLRRLDAERAARLHAERANQVKADFLAVVSHELRTPLNAIGGYTELLQMGLRGPLTPSQQEDLRRIDHSQRHLLSLVNAILNFAKLEAGRVSFEMSDVIAGEVLEDIEPLVQPQARVKGVKIRRDQCDSNVKVVADREKLQQILINLLSNAIKYTPAGGLVTLRCSAGRRHVRFEVSDTGLGIPADKIERVFEPFVQVNRSLSAPNEGVGLGLAISRELARGMRGTLSATSTEGEGSTFTLTLPLVKSDG